jgi:hypothetical protein
MGNAHHYFVFFQTYSACAMEAIYIVHFGRVRNRMDYD